MRKILSILAVAAIFCALILTLGCAEEVSKLAPGKALPPKLHVGDANAGAKAAQTDANNSQIEPDVKAELVSANGNFASWNAFAPGKGINTPIGNDFAWKITARLPSRATITGITINNAGTRQAWSTKKGAYPLVVVGPNAKGETVQLVGSYGQKFGDYNAGTYKFMAYGQPEADSYGEAINPFNGGDVLVELADKTPLKGLAKKSTILPEPEPPQNEPVDYRIFQAQDSLRARFSSEADIDETVIIADIITGPPGGQKPYISISRNGGPPEKILEGQTFEVKRRAYPTPYIIKAGIIGSDSTGNVRAILYLYKSTPQ